MPDGDRIGVDSTGADLDCAKSLRRSYPSVVRRRQRLRDAAQAENETRLRGRLVVGQRSEILWG